MQTFPRRTFTPASFKYYIPEWSCFELSLLVFSYLAVTWHQYVFVFWNKQILFQVSHEQQVDTILNRSCCVWWFGFGKYETSGQMFCTSSINVGLNYFWKRSNCFHELDCMGGCYFCPSRCHEVSCRGSTVHWSFTPLTPDKDLSQTFPCSFPPCLMDPSPCLSSLAAFLWFFCDAFCWSFTPVHPFTWSWSWCVDKSLTAYFCWVDHVGQTCHPAPSCQLWIFQHLMLVVMRRLVLAAVPRLTFMFYSLPGERGLDKLSKMVYLVLSPGLTNSMWCLSAVGWLLCISASFLGTWSCCHV